jgi:hypothetical protein
MWTSGFPKTLQFSSDFSAGEVTAVQEMGDQWSTSLNNKEDFFDYNPVKISEKFKNTGSNSVATDGVLGVYKAIEWPYPDYPDALAVTQIYAYRYNKGKANEYVDIQEADIMVNYDGFTFDLVTPHTSNIDYDLRTVVLHEMGHFLGLQHKAKTSDRTQSVMYPSIYSYEEKRVPKAIDIADIASIYNISLSALSANAIVMERPDYRPMDTGTPEKTIIELRASGECVHHIDGAEVLRHQVSLK